MSNNEATIKLLREWRERPCLPTVKSWSWQFYRGRHGGRSRYLLPSVVIALEETCIMLREGFITIRWWKWELAITFHEHEEYAAERNP